MGEEFVLTDLQRLTCTNFVINLYGGNTKQTLHELRCTKAKSSVHPRLIPPTEDSFTLHLLRCVIQLWIWRNETTPQHHRPDLSDFGYECDGTEAGLRPKLMSQPAAAPELLNDLVCECLVCNEKCVCLANHQPCTVACCCSGNTQTDDIMCTNIFTLTSEFSHEIESSDDE